MKNAHRLTLLIIILGLLGIRVVAWRYAWINKVRWESQHTPYRITEARAATAENMQPDSKPQIELGSITIPVRLQIPVIGLDRIIDPVGLDNLGGMATPTDNSHVGWYKLGVKPGETGNAVLDGHYDLRSGGPGVFNKLNQVKSGDEIQVIDAQNHTLTFTVYKTEIYKDTEFPINPIFGPANDKNLNLITCAGIFDKTVGEYRDRFVAFARLKEPVQ